MDFVLEVLVQFLVEVVWAALASLVDARHPTGAGRHAVRLVGYVLIGLIAGAFSLWLYPTHVLQSVNAQRAWLVLSPLAAASLVFIFHLFFPRQPRGWPMVHAAGLAAAFTTLRFFALG